MNTIKIMKFQVKVVQETTDYIRVLFPFKMWIPKSVLICKLGELPELPNFFVRNEAERFNWST